VSKDFVVGVKLNSSDYVQGGLTEDDALYNVETLANTAMVDFVEVSGGNYENPCE
jgi:2,4-dienoyl-CoA reductase-like NADH-dependent reductase (Old Yellow Enzyme family)